MTTVDLALDERVALRVIDATDSELRAVAHQSGLRRASLGSTPQLSLRFVDRLPLSTPLRLVGADIGCTDDAVVMLPGGPRLLVPIRDIGGPIELLCEHGATTVPLLLDLLNASALAAGLLPLHAGAFVLDGVGAIVTGWSKGGKTETVLGVMTGWPAARFVGDEWVYVDPRTRDVLGSQHPVRLWGWQLDQLPELRGSLPAKDLRRFRVIRTAERRHAALSHSMRRSPPAKVLSAVLPLLRSRHGAYVEPADLFGAERVRDRMTLDRLVQVESASGPDTTTRPTDGAVVSERMTWSLRHERRELMAAYDAFRYVNPGTWNPWLDAVDALEARLLTEAFRDVPAVEVRHPYPVDIAELARVVVDAVS
jgi:hypothetical protein